MACRLAMAALLPARDAQAGCVSLLLEGGAAGRVLKLLTCQSSAPDTSMHFS